MIRFASTLVVGLVFAAVTNSDMAAYGQANCGQADCGQFASVACADIMNTENYTAKDFRRMFRCGTTPTREELIGTWRGVNKGMAQLIGYNQFIKEIVPCGNVVIGDNIQVHQVPEALVRCYGWQPKIDASGQIERQGKFAIGPPRGIGPFRHGAVFSYRKGGNPKGDPSRLLVDKVVKLDDDHLLGRAWARIGPVYIPVSFFVLERVR